MTKKTEILPKTYQAEMQAGIAALAQKMTTESEAVVKHYDDGEMSLEAMRERLDQIKSQTGQAAFDLVAKVCVRALVIDPLFESPMFKGLLSGESRGGVYQPK